MIFKMEVLLGVCGYMVNVSDNLCVFTKVLFHVIVLTGHFVFLWGFLKMIVL